MTKRDFEVIAAAVATLTDPKSHRDGWHLPPDLHRFIVNHFADRLERAFTNFDRDKFVAAAQAWKGVA